MTVYREDEDLITTLVGLGRELEEVKTKQFIGSQIVMQELILENEWDLTLRTKYSLGGGQGYYGLAMVTASNPDGRMLLAGISAQYSEEMFRNDPPSPIADNIREFGNYMRWHIPVFSKTLNHEIKIKVQFVSDATILASLTEL